MNWKVLCVTVLTAFVLSAAASASSLTLSATLNPVQWNTLIESTSASNQLTTGQGDIYVGRTNQAASVSIRRGLIEFNIAGSIPSDATITGGSLTMCDVLGSNGSQTISLYDVLQAWGQGTSNGSAMGVSPANNDATWLYTFYDAASPSLSSTWSTPGGYFSASPSASAVDNGGAGSLVTWSGSAMVGDIQGWLNNPADNFGWLMQGNESTSKTTKQYESSASNDSFGVVPLLTVQYSVPVPEPAAGAVAGVGGALAGACALVRGKRGRDRL